MLILAAVLAAVVPAAETAVGAAAVVNRAFGAKIAVPRFSTAGFSNQ